MPDINLHNVDCLEFMREFPDNYYSLAIVDPPYGIGINESIGRRKGMKHSGFKKAYWDNNRPDKNYFDNIFRISKNQIIWGGNYFNMPPTKSFIIWDKGYPEDVSFSRYEYAWTNHLKTSKGFLFNGQANRNKIHPTQKPVQLYKWLLMNYAKPGDTIFDSHGGSMSLAIACYDLGFDATICEIDKDYYDAALKRFEQHKQQLTLDL